MALTRCPDCGREVSDQAVACPQCGRPMRKIPQVIERTSKHWKNIQAAGYLIAVVGVLLVARGCSASPLSLGKPWIISGVVIGMVGVLIQAMGKSGAWWHHG